MLTLVTGPSVAVTGTTTSGSAAVAGVSASAIAGALAVSGAGIPPGTFVASVDSATQITLTQPATADGTTTLTFGIEPVTLPEAKKHLKLDADLTEDDDLIAVLITAARRKCETETWTTFLRSTWDYTLSEFPWAGSSAPYGTAWPWNSRANQIRIPNPPLVSVTSVTYLDSVGSPQVYPAQSYGSLAGIPGIVYPAYGTTWPYTGRADPNGVIVRYVAGYGTTADDVPATIKAAMKLLLSAWYVNRGDEDKPLPMAVQALLACDQTGAIA
jgi:uncharacterized phiE125 gp8 family phage protein